MKKRNFGEGKYYRTPSGTRIISFFLSQQGVGNQPMPAGVQPDMAEALLAVPVTQLCTTPAS